MEDQVPFKVFTFWGENEKPEVRRFGIDKGVVTSFQYLKSKLEDIFPALKDKIYTVNWKDEEEDEVTVSSDDELMMALIAMRSQDLAKLYVRIKDPEPADDERDIVITLANAPIKHSSTHFGVVCDGCESPVVGFRYKCTSCEDYDLCGKCENAGLHPEHCMVRIPMPTMPYQALKAAIKRSRHILKTVANNVEECPYKKNRRDRSCEKKHGGDHGHGGHGDHRRDRHHRRRSGWLDTFATYMNEFANLAGDVGLDAESGPDSSKTSETNAQKKAENTQGEQPNASAKNATANENPRESFGPCPFMPNNVSFEVIQNILGQYMNGNLDLKAFIPQPENEPKEAPQASTSGQSADASVNTKTDTNNAAVNTNDVEMPQAEQQASESIKSETTSQSSASSVRDESPDKGDDWTVINKEKDLMDGYMKSSDQSELGAPIGFNLPAEFQERVKISEGQNLYPPLNAATAVFNPQVVERPVLPPPIQPQQAPVQRPAATAPPQPKPQQQPPQPQPQPPKPQPPPPQQQQRPPQPPQQQRPPQPQPQQRPQQQRPQQPLQQPHWLRHPNPRIDASLQQMLAMGFTNDGGWLTSLLENKDGNIAAVLDLLTPVNSRN